MPALKDIRSLDSALRAQLPHLHDLLDHLLLVLCLYLVLPHRLGDKYDLAIPLRHNLGHRICPTRRLSNLYISDGLQLLKESRSIPIATSDISCSPSESCLASGFSKIVWLITFGALALVIE